MMNRSKDEKKSGLKRTVIEWVVIGIVVAILYFTGYHTVVLGTMQRALLWTGIFDPDVSQVKTVDGPALSSQVYDFQLFTPAGKKIAFNKFKGNVLFINVWASWCPPCRAEMPTIETLYNQVSDHDDIKFILISLDKKPKKATQFMEDNGYPMPYYFPASRMPNVFRSAYIPSTYVISKGGKIIYKHGGIADYSSEVFKNWLLKKANAD